MKHFFIGSALLVKSSLLWAGNYSSGGADDPAELSCYFEEKAAQKILTIDVSPPNYVYATTSPRIGGNIIIGTGKLPMGNSSVDKNVYWATRSHVLDNGKGMVTYNVKTENLQMKMSMESWKQPQQKVTCGTVCELYSFYPAFIKQGKKQTPGFCVYNTEAFLAGEFSPLR